MNIKKIAVITLVANIAVHVPCIKAYQQISLWEKANQTQIDTTGGLEAETSTWHRKNMTFNTEVSSQEQWNISVDDKTRPNMKFIKIECTEGLLQSPFILSNNNYDFRSVPKLIDSITKNTKSDEEKALSIRELLIGEGFYFHFGFPQITDPLVLLTSSGFGDCRTHAQIFEQLCLAAGLKGRSIDLGDSHTANEIFYSDQWHFYDANGESLFRKLDGVIPSFEEIRNKPNLVPTGDIYGRTVMGIASSRWIRSVYSTPEKDVSIRKFPIKHRYETLDFFLRKGESITWFWQDADFTHYRSGKNGYPVYGKGVIEYTPQFKDINHKNKTAITIPVNIPYPIMEISLLAKTDNITLVDVSVSKDNGKSWIVLKGANQGFNQIIWRRTIDNPDNWINIPDESELKEKENEITTGKYGYTIKIILNKNKGIYPSLSDINLKTTFRHYPPTLAFLEPGNNTIKYVDKNSGNYRANVTIQWQQKERLANLSTNPKDYGFTKPQSLTHSSQNAQLPTFAASKDKLYILYTIEEEDGFRKIVYQSHEKSHWTKPTIVKSKHKSASHPVGIVDTEGNLWIAYQTSRLWDNSDIYVIRVGPDGTQTQPIIMNDNDPHHIAFFPSISSYKNRITVAWEGGLNNVDLANAWKTEVGWIKTFDGTKWNQPVLIKGDPFPNLGVPRILYDSRGKLHLTATKGPRYYLTVNQEPKALQWFTAEWMYHSRGGDFFEDTKGNIWVAFDAQNSGTTNEIYCRMLPSPATNTDLKNWTDILRVSEDDKKPSIYPTIAGIDEYHLIIAWMDYRNKNAEIYAKIFRENQWSPDILISNGTSKEQAKLSKRMTPNQILLSKPKGLSSEYPRMILDNENSIWITWQDKTNSHSQVMVSRYLPRPIRHNTYIP